MRLKVPLPNTVRNPLSLVGVAVTTTAAVLFAVLFVLESLGAIANPYLGLLVFVTVPLVFVFGLLLIPVGSWWARHRRRHQLEPLAWPVIDLRDSRHRTLAVAGFVLTAVNIVIVSMAAYGGVHYMDSPAFCGQVCHTTMEPEFSAAAVWPHARVGCAECHVGPGAGAAFEAKLAGTRQLYHIVTNQVPRPVRPPDRLIHPAHVTCEGCHWSSQTHGDRLRVIREYANDEANTESVTTLRLHVGGGAARGAGIHWHASPGTVIEFASPPPGKEAVPYVRVTDRDRGTREFVVPGATAAQFASAPLRRMDCTDCHNRPAHTMFATAARAVDTAIAEARIPRGLPFVRREAIAALEQSHATREAGLQAIASRLRAFYASRPDTDPRLLDRVVAGTQELWSRNVFPAMKVTFGTYPSHAGHVDSLGCFRCHDDEHKSADGGVLSQSCELCHTLPE
jgi:hypothetical protein